LVSANTPRVFADNDIDFAILVDLTDQI